MHRRFIAPANNSGDTILRCQAHIIIIHLVECHRQLFYGLSQFAGARDCIDDTRIAEANSVVSTEHTQKKKNNAYAMGELSWPKICPITKNNFIHDYYSNGNKHFRNRLADSVCSVFICRAI